MKTYFLPNHRGFTLIELMVVIAISVIVFSAAAVGLGNTTDNRPLDESAEHVKDVVQQVEMKALQDLTRAEIEFLPGCLVIDEQYGDAPAVDLNHTCPSPMEGFVVRSNGRLTKETDLHGITSSAEIFASADEPVEICFEFDSASDTQWVYRLRTDSGERTIRFVYPGLTRDFEPVIETGGDDLRLVIQSSGVSKQFLKNGDTVQEMTLILRNADDPSRAEEVELR